MALNGDLEHLHIVDIIQLIHTTRKSGTFSVKGKKGESRIIFGNGYIVGASHLNNKVRIGTVLVRMNFITLEDLTKALELQKKAGKSRKPLISTLMELGKLKPENASRGLKKLIEITMVELIGWTQGTFSFDTDSIAVSAECKYLPGKMEQEMSLDAQMVLMDALRVFDERERDRNSGKDVPSYEELFTDVMPTEKSEEKILKSSIITADDLGLADLDLLEKKIPQSFSVNEVFDLVEIHRQKIKETLSDFSADEQEMFVSFLEKFSENLSDQKGPARQEGHAKAIILFSHDHFIKYSVMTVCKTEGGLVFATDDEGELDRIIAQCFLKKILPVPVFDVPDIAEGWLSEEKMGNLRKRIKEKYPQVSIIQLTAPADYTFTIKSYHDCVRAVFPKPLKEHSRETFIADTIIFLESFKSYIKDFASEQTGISMTNKQLIKLKDSVMALLEVSEPSDIFLAMLQHVSEIFERVITFAVRPTELVGEQSIGVYAEKDSGPISAAGLNIPLTRQSIFRNAIEKGIFFYGNSEDKILKEHLFDGIGAPLQPFIIVLPVKSRGRTIALTYGDFGRKKPLPAEIDALEILTAQAGLILDNLLYRKHLQKASQQK